MDYSPPLRRVPPMMGIRRSATMPPRPLSIHDRTPLSTTKPTVDVLYSHHKARIVSFEPRPNDAKHSLSSRASHDYDYPVDTVETLPRASHNEEILATGPISIVKRPESTSFLMAGLPDRTRPIHALMRNSQCWCVDGLGEFVLRAGYLKYERIELPYETEEDKRKVQQFKDVLAGILKYESTPCPFKRGFRVDLPENALTPRRKGTWRRKSGSVASSPMAGSPLPLQPRKARTFRAASDNFVASAVGQEWEVPPNHEQASEEESMNDDSSLHSPVLEDNQEASSEHENINERISSAEGPPSSHRVSSLKDYFNQRGTRELSVNEGRSESGSGDGEDGSRSSHSEGSGSEPHSENISEQQTLPPPPVSLVDSHGLAEHQVELLPEEPVLQNEPPVALGRLEEVAALPKPIDAASPMSEPVLLPSELEVESVKIPEPIETVPETYLAEEELPTSATNELSNLEPKLAIAPAGPQDLTPDSPKDVPDDISISSYADSFHSLSPLEQHASASSPPLSDQLSPTPRAATLSSWEPMTPSPTNHRRGISDVTVTDSSRPQPLTIPEPLTPSPSSHTSEIQEPFPSQHPSAISPLSPPLSPAQQKTLPTQLLNTARHLMLGIGVKMPIQATLLVIHILSRIRGGATLSDLLSGDLFTLPEEWRSRGKKAEDGDEDMEEEEWEEDDFGIPIRRGKKRRDPQNRSREESIGGLRRRTENKREEEDEGDRDSLFDLD